MRPIGHVDHLVSLTRCLLHDSAVRPRARIPPPAREGAAQDGSPATGPLGRLVYRGGPHEQERDAAVAEDLIRDTAQAPSSQARASMGSHYDQRHLVLAAGLSDGFR